jgi:predicted Zn finger-like uncharacterized protein
VLTRCPRCETTFRVTPEQLKARHGRVRCGHCQNVFDALDTLIDATVQQVPAPVRDSVADETPAEVPESAAPWVEPAEVQSTPVEPTSVEAAPASTAELASQPSATEPSSSAEEAIPPEPAQEPEPEPIPIPAVTEPPAEPTPQFDSEPAEELAAVVPPPPSSHQSPVDTPEPDAPPSSEIAAEKPAPEEVPPSADEVPELPPLEPLLHEGPEKRTWPWALGAVAVLMLLLAQAAIHYRTEIAVLAPGAKPLLNALCAPFDCEVSLPHKSELVGIESSNLSPDSGGKLLLTATLKNRAPFAQQFPALELTLTDTNDQPLARRVLAPADYLTPPALAAGFPANGELAVNLTVDAVGMPAAGYQLYLFYP